jgi:phage protein D
VSVIPLYQQAEPFYVPAFEVRMTGAGGAAGQALPGDVVRDAIEVTFSDSIDRVDSFTLTLNNWDADARQPVFLGAPNQAQLRVVAPGTAVQLLMGYQGRSSDLGVMTSGMITTLEADFPEAGAPRLTVGGKSLLERFRNRQYTWAWPSQGEGDTTTESQIALDLARQPDSPPGRPGLGFPVRVNPQAAGQETAVPYVMMNNQYPIVFLMQLARRKGYDLFLSRDPGAPASDPGFLYFGPSQRITDVTYELDWGKSLVSFKPTISLARQVTKVTVLGWDRRRKQPIQGIATLADIPPINADLQPYITAIGREEVVTDVPVESQAEATQKAQQYLSAQLLDLVEATGVTVGLPDLRAGRLVTIGGLDNTLNGRWFIKQTTHTINDSGYRTTFVARRENLPGSTA